jgi:CheY-like chemotaxis protein
LLREDGYDVEAVLDGVAAIARLGRTPLPDVLVADYKLPHADGLAVAGYGRSRHKPLHIVLVTSYPEVLVRLNHPPGPPAIVLTKGDCAVC